MATSDGPRIALLPMSAMALLSSAVAGLAVVGLLRAGAPLAPLSLLIFIVLPWVPLPVPGVFLVWTGRLHLLIWAAVLLLLAIGPARRLWARTSIGAGTASVIRSRPRLVAGVLSAVVFGTGALYAAPWIPGGDEPHYLIITQSLLLDGDLRIENNHLRGDYQPYFSGQLHPDYIRRGVDGAIYSIHAPGLPAIIAPAFAVGGYPAVVIFLVGVAALGGALTWHVAWLATRDRCAAWFGWAAIALSPTLIFHTFTIYPDGVAGILVLTGFWALLRTTGPDAAFPIPQSEAREIGNARSDPRAWILHGAALAVLPWLHTRFAVLAGSLGVLVLLRIANRRESLSRDANARESLSPAAANAVGFLVVPAISALCWVAYFVAIYGTPDPSAPYGTAREFSASFIPGGLAGLLFDQRFGLIANAPVLLLMVAGIGAMLAGEPSPAPGSEQSSGSPRRLALEILFVIAPYLLIATSYAMWWGGWSAPARFAAAVLPALAIPCAVAWTRFRSPASRTISAGALALTACISAVLLIPERGRLAYNSREVPALLLEWASQLADLSRGLPLWIRGGEAGFFREIAVWSVALLTATLAVHLFSRRCRVSSLVSYGTVTALVFAVAGMIAMAATWRLNGSPGTTATVAQLAFLRRLSHEPRVLTAVIQPLKRIRPESLIGMIRIEPGPHYSSIGGAAQNPLVTIPALPAGRYRIRPSTNGGGGLLMLGIGSGQYQSLLRTETLTAPPQATEIDFPVDVRALIVSGDEEARRSVTGISIEPLSTVRADERLTDQFARRGMRYGGTSVFFFDDGSYPEPDGFWVRGARTSSIVIQPDAPAGKLRLAIRNAPVQNNVSIRTGAWRVEIDLAPGEERDLELPRDGRQGAALVTIRSRSGFRPSEVDPGNGDDRYLGVWIRIDADVRTWPPLQNTAPSS